MNLPLDGDEEVTFDPGTQPGDVKVLKDKGVRHLNGHGRGDRVEILAGIVAGERVALDPAAAGLKARQPAAKDD